jgi:hypothetical protein
MIFCGSIILYFIDELLIYFIVYYLIKLLYISIILIIVDILFCKTQYYLITNCNNMLKCKINNMIYYIILYLIIIRNIHSIVFYTCLLTLILV